ncbi:MAG: hypothetical protein AAFR56_00250 [Chloroflexota bacterium]
MIAKYRNPVAVIDTGTRETLNIGVNLQVYPRSVALAANREYLVVSDFDRAVVIHVASEEIIFSTEGTDVAEANEVLFSDVHNAAIITGDSTLLIYDIATGKYSDDFAGFSQLLNLTLTPDGNILICADMTGKVQFIDLQSRKRLRSMRLNSEVYYGVAVSPDQQFLYTWDSYGASQWLATSGERVREFDAPESCSGGTLDRTGTKLFCADSEDGHIYVYNTTNGDRIAILKGHTSTVSSMAISDDNTLYTSDSITVRRWNLETLTGEVFAGT